MQKIGAIQIVVYASVGEPIQIRIEGLPSGMIPSFFITKRAGITGAIDMLDQIRSTLVLGVGALLDKALHATRANTR